MSLLSGQQMSSAPVDHSESGDVCIPNISAPERRKRLIFGVIGFALTFAVLIALVATGASRWWRLALFPLFAGSATSAFQWRDKT